MKEYLSDLVEHIDMCTADFDLAFKTHKVNVKKIQTNAEASIKENVRISKKKETKYSESYSEKKEKSNQERKEFAKLFEQQKEKILNSIKESEAQCQELISHHEQNYIKSTNIGLDTQERNEQKISMRKDAITEATNEDLDKKLEDLRAQVETLQSLMNKSATFFEEEMKNQKISFMGKSKDSNDLIKEIKKKYIKKNEDLDSEKNLHLNELDQEIKKCNNKYSELQKPFLQDFKNKLIEIDKELIVVKRNYNFKSNRMNLKYDRLVMFKKKNLAELNAAFKKELRKTDNPRETNKKYRPLVREASKEIDAINNEYSSNKTLVNKEYVIDQEKLKLKKRLAELEKNKDIALNKINCDYDVMAIQEKIKLENSIYLCKKRRNEIEEIKEITEIELTFSKDDNQNTKLIRTRACDNSFFRKDYLMKIDEINSEINFIEERERIKKAIDLKRIEINNYKNYILSNLSIEKSKIIRDYNTYLLKNKQKLAEITGEYNINLASISLEKQEFNSILKVDLANENRKYLIISEEGELSSSTQVIRHSAENSKISNESAVEGEKIKKMDSISTKENEILKLIVCDSAKEIHSINIGNLTSCIDLSNYHQEKKSILNKMLSSIEEVINYQVEYSENFKYTQLRNEISEQFNEKKVSIFNKKNHYQNILQSTNKVLDDLEYEKMDNEHNILAYYDRKNQMIKSHVKSQESKYQLGNIRQTISSMNLNIKKLKQQIDAKTNSVSTINGHLVRLDDQFLILNRITNKNIDILSKKQALEIESYSLSVKKIRRILDSVFEDFLASEKRIKVKLEKNGDFQKLVKNLLLKENISLNKIFSKIIDVFETLFFFIFNVQSETKANYEESTLKKYVQLHRNNKQTKKSLLNASKDNKIKHDSALKKLMQKETYQLNQFKIKELIAKKKFSSLVEQNMKNQKKIIETNTGSLKAIDENVTSIRHYYTSMFKNYEINNKNRLSNLELEFSKKIEDIHNNQKNASNQFDKDLDIIKRSFEEGLKDIDKNHLKNIAKLDLDTQQAILDLENLQKEYNNALDELNFEKQSTVDDCLSKYRFDCSSANSDTKRNILSEQSKLYRKYRYLFKKKNDAIV